jgi:hypothetical protein
VRMTMMYVDLHPVENVYRGPVDVKSSAWKETGNGSD